MNEKKCVMIVDDNLPLGLIANTTAILGNTLGSHIPEVVGQDVLDKDNNNHLGIIEIPIPILKGNKELLFELRERLYNDDYNDLMIADFSNVAQSCKTYDEFIGKMKNIESKELEYYGIGLYGDKKKINKLTGSIGLLK